MPALLRTFLVIISVLLAGNQAAAEEPQDCQLKILHSAIGDTHTFNLKVTCTGNYTPLTYLLRARRSVDGVMITDSQTGTFNIHVDSRTVGDIKIDLEEGDVVKLEGKILQACEVLGKTLLEYAH